MKKMLILNSTTKEPTTVYIYTLCISQCIQNSEPNSYGVDKRVRDTAVRCASAGAA